MYLVNTQPDICFVVNTLSQFQVEPRHEHCIVAKHVLRYIRGTINYGLRYTASSNIQLHGFTDSDWARSADDRKSTSGMCFSLGSAMISWGSRKQKSVALSTTEAEYSEISLIRLIKIFATVLMLWRADLIHWGFLDAF
jgi:hypothetical protein